MDWHEAVFLGLELIGTVSFSLSGAMTAIQKRSDIFGILFLGAVTAVGGGVLRDVLLGNVPPAAFVERKYVMTALAAALALFLLVSGHQERYRKWEAQVSAVNNVFDAVGLGIFSVVGVRTVQAAGLGDNFFLSLFLGLTTGVGGGVLRSMMLLEVPFVLTKRVYAVASLLGSAAYWALIRTYPGSPFAVSIASSALVFAVRMLATKYRWDLPRAMEE